MQVAVQDFMARPDTSAERTRQVRDLLWLAILGAAARCPMPLPRALTVIHDIAGPAWPRADDAAADCAHEMLRGGHLEPAEPGRFQTTAHGLDCLERLIAVPLGGPRSMAGQVGMRLKLAYLDLVSAAARRQVLADLVADHQQDLALARIDLGQIWAGPHGRAWFRGDIDRLRRDRDMLREMLAREDDAGGELAVLAVRQQGARHDH